jgi:homoserine kinase type II
VDVLRRWGIPPDAAARRTERGTNNTTLLISLNDDRWVLRVSQNLTTAQVAAEHRLLGRLRSAGLPFAVPEPIPALDGHTVIDTPDGPATLCRWLPGVRPDLTDPVLLARAGEALGRLDVALRDVPPRDAPHDWRRADPLAVHPAVPDVPDLCADLDAAGADTAPLRDAADRVTHWFESGRGTLASQVVHGDFAASNMLTDPDSGQVTAVLDFEIAGADFRAQDITAALIQTDALDGPDWQDRVAALSSGYGKRVTLTKDEIAAIPHMIEWRAVGTVLWRAGRWRRGQDPLALVTDRIANVASTADWLTTHGSRLVDLITQPRKERQWHGGSA